MASVLWFIANGRDIPVWVVVFWDALVSGRMKLGFWNMLLEACYELGCGQCTFQKLSWGVEAMHDSLVFNAGSV